MKRNSSLRIKPHIVIQEVASHRFRILNRITLEVQRVRMKLIKIELIYSWLESCRGGGRSVSENIHFMPTDLQRRHRWYCWESKIWKTSVPQTILWKKLYILKLESQNVKTFRQEMNSHLCSVFFFSTWKKLEALKA